MKINLNGSKRKDIAKKLGELLNLEVKYLGVPSCNYSIREYILDKDCDFKCDDKNVKQAIRANFNVEEEIVAQETSNAEVETSIEEECVEQKDENIQIESDKEFTEEKQIQNSIEQQNHKSSISMPLNFFDEKTRQNLNNLIESKGKLFKKALNTNSLQIYEKDGQLVFPWFKNIDDEEHLKAYTQFIQGISELAKNSAWISKKPCVTDNDKYTSRSFLLRLGFISDEYKQARKILLQNLSGSSAFRRINNDR